MAKIPYNSPDATVDPYVDAILSSNDNAFFDPWGIIEAPV